MTFLVVGLGNPGEQYTNTRHNAGREIASAYARAIELGEFRFEKKWKAEITEGVVANIQIKGKYRNTQHAKATEKIAVILPNTMMNKSGTAVGVAARFFKIKPKDIFIIHDDADIALGATKLSFGKRSAGHKGVESVIRALKTKDFWRLRIGIAGRRDIPAEKLVLKKFTPDEARIMKKVMKKTMTALSAIAADGPERAMNSYNS